MMTASETYENLWRRWDGCRSCLKKQVKHNIRERLYSRVNVAVWRTSSTHPCRQDYLDVLREFSWVKLILNLQYLSFSLTILIFWTLNYCKNHMDFWYNHNIGNFNLETPYFEDARSLFWEIPVCLFYLILI